MRKLSINKVVLEDELKVELFGAMNEDAEFNELETIDQPSVSFDFDKIEMINSCGIREWIKFLEKVPSTKKIKYRNCPQIIIEQVNMVHGFFRQGSLIESFYAPYFCEACNKEKKVLILTDQVSQKKAPKINCPDCGGGMDFDAIEAQYLAFIGKT